jgi:hypothetical protein
MGKSKKPPKFEVKGFIKGLRSLLEALPSEPQKQKLNDAFTELIGFLTDLQNILLAMPSTEDVSQLRQSLPKLEEFYASAKKVPAIAASVGVGRGSKKRKLSARKTKKVEIDAKRVLANLEKLPADEIRPQLDDKTYSKQSLRLIASEMGLKTASSATRKSLADKIASDIVNQRMRDRLAGRTNRESTVS